MNITEAISRRIEAYAFRKARVQRTINLLAALRLLLFVLIILGLSFSFDGAFQLQAAALALTSFGAFLFLMVRHDRCYRYKTQCELVDELLRADLARARYHFKDVAYPDPIVFADQHPFAHDLDLSGRFSLLKAIDDSFHRNSKRLLQRWLDEIDTAAAIRARQEAVADLTDRKRLRTKLALAARLDSNRDLDPGDLKAWLNTPAPWTLRTLPYVFGRLLAAVTTTSVVLHFLFGMADVPWWPWLVLQLVVFYLFDYFHKPFLFNFMQRARAIAASCAVVRTFERIDTKAALLVALQERLRVGGKLAGPNLQKLLSIDQMLQYRGNAFAHLFLNGLFLWDQHQLRRLRRWRETYGAALPHWVAAIFEIEALSSLANFRWLFPGRPFPELVDSRQVEIEAEALAHPAIPADLRVGNDYRLERNGLLHLITGSNMSGKSTFLRTIGLNLVLARMGAPVCARQMRCSLPRLMTSIKIQDSLAEGVSYFYAEVQRIKLILDEVTGEGPPVCYLLDEVLKGTNSRERLIATKAMVRYLLDKPAAGLITTHDLELLAVHRAHPQAITTFHFQEQVRDGELFFDYRLKPGELTSTNALRLMRLAEVPLTFDEQ